MINNLNWNPANLTMKNHLVYIILFTIILGLQPKKVSGQADKIAQLEKSLLNQKDTIRINTLITLSKLYTGIDRDIAKNYAGEALNLSEKSNFSKGKIEACRSLSGIYNVAGDKENSIFYFRKGLKQAEETENTLQLANCYNDLSNFYYGLGQLDSAEYAVKKAMKFAEQSKNISAQAWTNVNYGKIYIYKGDQNAACEKFFKAIDQFTALGDSSGLGNVYQNLGASLNEAGNQKDALKYFFKSYEIAVSMKVDLDIAWSLNGIAVAYQYMQDDRNTLNYYSRGLEMARKVKDPLLETIISANLGAMYSDMKEYEKANELFKRAMKLAKANGYNLSLIYSTGNIADNYHDLGDYVNGIAYGKQHLAYAKKYNAQPEIMRAYKVLAKNYAGHNDFEQAYEALFSYAQMRDTIFNKEKSEQIEALRTQFETEKKEKEIIVLAEQKQNAEFRRNIFALIAVLIFLLGLIVFYYQKIQRKKDRLFIEKDKEIDEMKSQFFANISHEFRTPLTLILGPAIEMLAENHDEKSKHQLEVIKRNANRLLQLVNELLELSRLESGKLTLQVSKSDIVAIIKGVTLSFHSVMDQKEIKLKLDISPDKLEMNFDKPKLETILTNLISNAFKFTPQGGEILISASIQ